MVNKYNKIKTEVSTDVISVVEALEDITSVIADFVAEIDKIVGDIESTIGHAVDSVTSAKGVITPVHEAMKIVHDILKPVLWLIHAIEFVFKYTVEPLIDYALKETGIEALADDLEAKLLKYLGISAIIKDIEATLGGNKIKAYGAVFDLFNDASATSLAVKNWVELVEVLGEYQQAGAKQKPKLATEAVEDLINALVGTAVDVDKISFGGAPPPPPPSSKSASSSITSIPQGFDSTAASLTTVQNNLNKIKQIAVTVSGDTSA